MSDEQEDRIIEKLAKLLPLVRYLIGGAAVIGAGLVSVAAWVYGQQTVTVANSESIRQLSPRVVSLENWRTAKDAVAPVTIQDIHALDKRIQSQEDKLGAILDIVRKLEAKQFR